jgi:hypothetical protein
MRMTSVLMTITILVCGARESARRPSGSPPARGSPGCRNAGTNRQPYNPGVTALRTLLVVALAAVVHAESAGQAPAKPADTSAIVERGRRYVDAYPEAFTAVVSEERQVQRLIRPDGSVHKVRELTKDDRLEVSSTYSNFRRFEVSATEQIKREPYNLRRD